MLFYCVCTNVKMFAASRRFDQIWSKFNTFNWFWSVCSAAGAKILTFSSPKHDFPLFLRSFRNVFQIRFQNFYITNVNKMHWSRCKTTCVRSWCLSPGRAVNRRVNCLEKIHPVRENSPPPCFGYVCWNIDKTICFRDPPPLVLGDLETRGEASLEIDMI